MVWQCKTIVGGVVTMAAQGEQFLLHPCIPIRYIHPWHDVLTYTHVHWCTLMYSHVHSIYTHTLMYSHVYSCIHIYTHVYPCIPMYTYVHPCTLMHTHVHSVHLCTLHVHNSTVYWTKFHSKSKSVFTMYTSTHYHNLGTLVLYHAIFHAREMYFTPALWTNHSIASRISNTFSSATVCGHRGRLESVCRLTWYLSLKPVNPYQVYCLGS